MAAVKQTVSQWGRLNSVPIKSHLIITANNNEFWIIPKQKDAKLEIFNFNTNQSTYSKYSYKIKTQKRNILCGSYDSQNKLLYIITSTQIIIIDIETHKHQIVDYDMMFRSVSLENAASIISHEQLHIISSERVFFDLDNNYHILCKDQNNQFVLKHMHHFTSRISNPKIVNLSITPNKSANDMKITIVGKDVSYDGKTACWQYWNKKEVYGSKRVIGEYIMCSYPYVHDTDAVNGHCWLFFKDNKIMLKRKISRHVAWSPSIWYFFSNLITPIVPSNALLLRQSLKQSTLLFIGYTRSFIMTTIIPLDVIYVMNSFYLSYMVHLFDETGAHFMMSLDEIINNSQKYTGTIKSYDEDTKTGTIQIKGKIDEYSQGKYPLNGLTDGTKAFDVKMPLINALRNIFESFATNEDNTMSRDDMKKYILHCGASETSASPMIIKCIFRTHGDSDETFCLKGFLAFYATAIIDRPQYVVADLKLFGYDEDEIFKTTGECVNASFNQYEYNDENKVVYFDIIVDEDGSKHAFNVTKVYTKYSISQFVT